MTKAAVLAIFGGANAWDAADWTDSDDRVRGGSSQSYLTCTPSTAHFCGILDTEKLGGAGFASQRTKSEQRVWELEGYTGVEIELGKADSKKYTIILKDGLLPKSPNGREQSTVSWEYDFEVTKADMERAETQMLRIPFKDFKPTYRGKEKKDAKPLDLANIKRWSFMMRSFFDTQKGDFTLYIKSISAYKDEKSTFMSDIPNFMLVIWTIIMVVNVHASYILLASEQWLRQPVLMVLVPAFGLSYLGFSALVCVICGLSARDYFKAAAMVCSVEIVIALLISAYLAS